MQRLVMRGVFCALAMVVGALATLLNPAGAFALADIAYADIATTASTDVATTFKRVYLMAADAVPMSNPLTAQFKRTKKFKAGADGLYFNVKVETGGAVANVPDGKKLPNASAPKRKTGKCGIAHTYTVVAIGGQSIPLTDDTRNAFVSNLEDQLEDGMTRVKNDHERQTNGDGQGILCVIETVAGAPTYGAEKPYGLVNGGPGTMLLIEGMVVACINPANGAERSRAVIDSTDPDTEEFTTDVALANAEIGDYITLCNDSAATGTDKVNNYGEESSGINAAIASGDEFEDINGATVRRWNATVMSNGGTARPITEKLVAQLEARIKAKSGKKPDLFYTTRGISIEMQDQLSGRRRDTSMSVKLKGGFEGLDLNGRTVVEGDWCPKGRFYAINTDGREVGQADLAKMGYVDLDGAKLHRIEGRHAYRADLWFPHNTLWFSRNAHGVLADLEDDNSITR